MKESMLDRKSALDCIKTNRNHVKPNQGFWDKLLSWEKKMGFSQTKAENKLDEAEKIAESIPGNNEPQ